MTQRTVRVNQLVRHEISEILHTTYKDESVFITITDVDVSPDLRTAHVFYSVIGDADKWKDAHRFLEKRKKAIRQEVSKRVILKCLPQLKFVADGGMQRGAHIIELLDELDLNESGSGPAEPKGVNDEL